MQAQRTKRRKLVRNARKTPGLYKHTHTLSHTHNTHIKHTHTVEQARCPRIFSPPDSECAEIRDLLCSLDTVGGSQRRRECKHFFYGFPQRTRAHASSLASTAANDDDDAAMTTHTRTHTRMCAYVVCGAAGPRRTGGGNSQVRPEEETRRRARGCALRTLTHNILMFAIC